MNCETWWPFCMKHDHSCHGDPGDHAHLPLLHGPLLKQSWNFPVPGRLRMGREVYADFLIKNLGIAWKSACHAGIATPDWARDSKNAESNVAGKDIDPNPAWILGSGLSTLELGDTAFKGIIMLNPKIPKLKTHEIRECDWEEHGRTLIFESESQPLQRKLRVCTSLFGLSTSNIFNANLWNANGVWVLSEKLTALIPMDLPHEIYPPINFLPGISHDPWDWS